MINSFAFATRSYTVALQTVVVIRLKIFWILHIAIKNFVLYYDIWVFALFCLTISVMKKKTLLYSTSSSWGINFYERYGLGEGKIRVPNPHYNLLGAIFNPSVHFKQNIFSNIRYVIPIAIRLQSGVPFIMKLQDL